MYKIIIFIIIILLVLSGCSQSNESNTNIQTASQIHSEVTSSNSTVNDTTFRPDIDNIKEIMSLKKEQVINKLGTNYKIVDVGDGGQNNGLLYEKYGMSIVFDDFLVPDMIGYIICDDKVDIEGAKLGMTFSEIKKYLGKGENSEEEPIEPNQPKYILMYKIDNFIIWFGSKVKDGATTDLQIRRDYMDDNSNTKD